MGHKYKGRKKKKKKKVVIDKEKARQFHREQALKKARADPANSRQLFPTNDETPFTDLLGLFICGVFAFGIGAMFFYEVCYLRLTQYQAIEDLVMGLAWTLFSAVFWYVGLLMMFNRRHPLFPSGFWLICALISAGIALFLPARGVLTKEFHPESAGFAGAMGISFASAFALAFWKGRELEKKERELSGLDS